MIGCDVLRISAFKIFQHRDTETQRIIVIGELYGPLYGNYSSAENGTESGLLSEIQCFI